MVYEPQEDSFLLKEFVKKYAKGVVLDMGTGSGIQAREAAHSGKTKKVFAADIDKTALEYAKKHSNGKRHRIITWVQSDLFSKFKSSQKHSFDLIIFNAPYLPQERDEREIALEGGRQGHEVIGRFLSRAGEFLKPNGVILLVFSSLTPHMVDLIEQCGFVGKELGRRHIFFEDILVYELRKNPILLDLEKKGVCCAKYFARGKRGVIFKGKYGKKTVAIKLKRMSSSAQNTVPHEANMLKEINRHGLGPKFVLSTKEALVYEFVEGLHLRDVVGAKSFRAVCKNIFRQCFQLDLLHIDKKEMTRPYKHAIVRGSKVTLIDFERARKVEEAHNVTQFCQFMRNHTKDKRWINIGREYAQKRDAKTLKSILGMV